MSRNHSEKPQDIQGTFGQINKQAEESLAASRLREDEARQITFRAMVKQQLQIDSDSESDGKSSLNSVFAIDSAYNETMLMLDESSNEKEMIMYQKFLSRRERSELESKLHGIRHSVYTVNKQLVQSRLSSNALHNKLEYYNKLADLREGFIKDNSDFVKLFSCQQESLHCPPPVAILETKLAALVDEYGGNMRIAYPDFQDKIYSLIREIRDLEVSLRLFRLECDSKRIEHEAQMLQAIQESEDGYARALEEIKNEGISQVSALKIKMEECDGEAEKLQLNIGRLENQIDWLKTRLVEADTIQDSLRTERRTLKAELVNLNSNLDQLTMDNSSMRGQLERLKRIPRS